MISNLSERYNIFNIFLWDKPWTFLFLKEKDWDGLVGI